MKKTILLFVLLLAGCASSSVIKTIPDQVMVYKNDQLVGVTPYEFWDRDISGAETTLLLRKPGFQDKTAKIKKDVLYVHRIFCPPILALPWLFGYDSSYVYELTEKK